MARPLPARGAVAGTSVVGSMKASLARTATQLRLVGGCAHPRQAVVLAVVLGGLAYASGRPLREAGIAAAAVLLVQLVCGLLNDVFDRDTDRRGGTGGKPIADGRVPTGNAVYVLVILLLVSAPLSLQNGTAAGAALLLTYVVAVLHNWVLHRTVFSWVGWTATFALFPTFLSYGGWGGGVHGGPATWWVTGAAALFGFCMHFATTLPDLVDDNRSGVRNLPLVVALRTGAPRLLVITGVVTAVAIAGIVLVALGPGLRA